MDAETRHQLKTNELGELLERLRDLNNPYVKYPLIALGLLVVGWIGWASFSYFHRQGIELTWQKLAEIERQLDPNDPNYGGAVVSLQRLTQDSSDAALFASTRIQLARIRYDEAMRTPGERAAKLGEAKALLLEVRGASATPASLDAAAAFALASVCESLSESADRSAQLAEARKLYEELSTQPRFAGSGFVSLAKDRLSTLDTLSATIAFTPGMSPTPAPAPGLPGGDSSGRSPQLSVGEGMNVQQLSPEEIQQLLGKINAANPPGGTGTPPPPQGETPAPAQPAPAEPAPQPEKPAPAPQPEQPAPAPQPEQPAPAPQPENPPSGDGQ